MGEQGDYIYLLHTLNPRSYTVSTRMIPILRREEVKEEDKTLALDFNV